LEKAEKKYAHKFFNKKINFRALCSQVEKNRVFPKLLLAFQKWTKKMSKIEKPFSNLDK
jgi:hypothetical protein